MKSLVTPLCLLLYCLLSFSVCEIQAGELFPGSNGVTRQDVLRGSITPERAWWDLSYYHLSVKVDPADRSISGSNEMAYRVLSTPLRLQIELQPPMQLTRVEQDGQTLAVQQDGYSYFITPAGNQAIGSQQKMTLYFSGQPRVAKRAPWDGGITWAKDDNGLDFIASSNQGIGASIWWPNKDHGYDEPEQGVWLSVEVPENLMDVSNGRLLKVEHNEAAKTKTYHWRVVNPINNYGVNINIGDYVHFGERYQGELGPLDMDYYVLRDNLGKAKKQFKDATRTMEALEYWFGPYPFYQDSYKLVEAPYLGMEHQSSVTYGNGYQNGYQGRDRSETGIGLLFDFIIEHESGHEWFANSITASDVADLWIQESFTNYSESLFLEYFYGKEKAFAYIRGNRLRILNDMPLIGRYNVNQEGSSDMYGKGMNMLHTIRQIIDNDVTWRNILRGLNKTFYHQTVTSAQIESYISAQAGKDFSKVFDQYLRDVRVPVLEYFVYDKVMKYRWSNTVTGFDMPVRVRIGKDSRWLAPTTTWQKIALSQTAPAVVVDANFYVGSLNIMGG